MVSCRRSDANCVRRVAGGWNYQRSSNLKPYNSTTEPKTGGNANEKPEVLAARGVG